MRLKNDNPILNEGLKNSTKNIKFLLLSEMILTIERSMEFYLLDEKLY